MSHVPPLHPSTHRKEFSKLTLQQRVRLRQLIDGWISSPNDPVGEHLAAGQDPMLMIHNMGFISWHLTFLSKFENWLVLNGGQEFVPLPYWDPATPVPPELSKGNTNPHRPVPDSLRPGAIADIPDQQTLNTLMVPYHNDVHDHLGGAMPNPDTSPSDPIFWPFHGLLTAIYEHWRSH